MTDTSLVFDVIGRDRLTGVLGRALGNVRSTSSAMGRALTSGIGAAASALPGALAAVGATAGVALGGAVAAAAGAVVAGGVATIAASAAQVFAAGGVLGIGIALAAQQQVVKDAGGRLVDSFKDAFAPLGKILDDELVDALDSLRDLAQPIADSLRPAIEALQPAIGPLTDGIKGLVLAALPGFSALAEAGVGLFTELGPLLPPIGAALSDFMTTLAGGAPIAQSLITGGLGLLPDVIRGVATGMQWAMDAAAGFFYGLQSGDRTSDGVLGFFERVGAAVRGLYDLLVQGDFGMALTTAFGIEEDSPIVGFVLSLRDGLMSLGSAAMDVWAQISPVGQAIQGLLSGQSAGEVGGGLADKFAPIINGVQEIAAAFQTNWPVIKPIVEEIGTVLVDGLKKAAEDLGPIMTQVISVIGAGLSMIAAAIGPAVQLIKFIWDNFGDSIVNGVTTVWSTVVGVLSGAFTVIEGIFTFFTGLLTGDWSKMREGLVQIWDGLWKIVGSILTGAFQLMANAFNGGKELARSFGTFIGENLGNAMRATRDRIGQQIAGIVDFFRNLPGQVAGALSFFGSTMGRIGGDIMDGLRDGIVRAARRVATAAVDAVRGAINAAKDWLGIASPSRVWRDQVGVMMVAGAEQGIDQRAGALAATAQDAMPVPTPAVAGAGAGGPVTVVIDMQASTGAGRALLDLLRPEIRARGGNVQVVLAGAA